MSGAVQTTAVAPLPDGVAGHRMKPKRSTREKIDKLVTEGAKNYPAYLKLIYTGDSELSSEDEFSADHRSGFQRRDIRAEPIHQTHQTTCPAQSTHKMAFTPESDKLLDPGREKLATPISERTGFYPEPNGGYNLNEDDQLFDVDNTSSNHHNGKSVAQKPQAACVDNRGKEEERELRMELLKVQDDIASLKAVLSVKLQEAAELKHKLGITTMVELKQSIRESGTYQRTNAALKSLGAFASKKMGNLRNSTMFKSVEEKVGTVRQSRSMGNFKYKLTSMSTSRSENNVSDMAARHSNDESIDDEEDEETDDSSTSTSNPYSEI